MSQGEIAGTIEKFIRRAFRVMGDDPTFSRDVHLFETGYVDSAGVVELLEFVESTFDVKLADEHIFSERFTTINGISSIVVDVLMALEAPDVVDATGAPVNGNGARVTTPASREA